MASKRDERGVRTLDYEGYRPAGRKAEVVDPKSMDDVTALLTVADSRLKAKRTVENFPNTPEGLDRFKAATSGYFNYINDTNSKLADNPDTRALIPDLEGWAAYIGISRKTIYNYQERGGDWKDVIEYCKNAICSVKKQLSFTYKIPPVLAMFDLTNNHGYVNSSEFKIAGNTEREQEESRLQSKLDSEGLVFDESSGEYVPAIEDQGGIIDG